ncbi:MAG TPA: hypothetical protein VFL97_01605 [Nitrococcus sp.]|nr:hypothetical protein [Nitrococcus sp.]
MSCVAFDLPPAAVAVMALGWLICAVMIEFAPREAKEPDATGSAHQLHILAGWIEQAEEGALLDRSYLALNLRQIANQVARQGG